MTPIVHDLYDFEARILPRLREQPIVSDCRITRLFVMIAVVDVLDDGSVPARVSALSSA
jgi:hypothetical protein